MKFEEIETERMRLRKLTPDTFHFIYENFSDEELMAFLGLGSEEVLAKEKAKYAKGMTTYNRSFLNFQMLDKATGQLIGSCGYHTWYTDHKRAEIGYAMFAEDFKQKGLMSEALKVIVDYGFNSMDLHRIEAMIGPRNTASLKLVAKLGFVKEGLMREHYLKNGVMEDSIVFSLLRHEAEG